MVFPSCDEKMQYFDFVILNVSCIVEPGLLGMLISLFEQI